MRLRILHEVDVPIPTPIANESQPSFFKRFVSTIRSWFTTITDFFRGFGWDGCIFHKDNRLTDKVTSLFEDSHVDVIVYDSKIPNHYTFPGETIMGNPWVIKFKNIPDWLTLGIGGIIDLLINFLGTVEAIVRGICTPRNDKVTYNPATNKFKLQFKYCRSYVSTAMVDMLTEDELTAMILQDVGDNTLILYSIISDTITYSWIGACLLFLLRWGSLNTLANHAIPNPPEGMTSYQAWDKSIDDSVANSFTKFATKVAGRAPSFKIDEAKLEANGGFGQFFKEYILIILIALIFIRTITVYYRRRKTVFADEFPIKMGYGESFHSATVKLHSYINDEMTLVEKNMKNLNFIDKAIYKIRNSFYMKFQNTLAKHGWDDTIDFENRERLIREKTDKYQPNIDKKLIDRTGIIGTEVPNTVPLLKYMDKIHNKITGQNVNVG